MDDVVSIRLPKEQKQKIKEMAKKESRNQSGMIRKLIQYGEKYRAIKAYKKGEMTLGQVAEELNISIREAMDLLVEHGAKADIDYDTYIESHQNLKENW